MGWIIYIFAVKKSFLIRKKLTILKWTAVFGRGKFYPKKLSNQRGRIIHTNKSKELSKRCDPN